LEEVIILISGMISSALRNASSLCLQVFLMPKELNWKLLWLKDGRIVVIGIFVILLFKHWRSA